MAWSNLSLSCVCVLVTARAVAQPTEFDDLFQVSDFNKDGVIAPMEFRKAIQIYNELRALQKKWGNGTAVISSGGQPSLLDASQGLSWTRAPKEWGKSCKPSGKKDECKQQDNNPLGKQVEC